MSDTARARSKIINYAFTHLGSKVYPLAQIEMGVDDNTPQGTSNIPAIRQANLWYDQTRDEVLSAYPWTFATKRDALAPANIPLTSEANYTGDWSNRYHYPRGAVQIQYLVDETRTSTAERITNEPYAIEESPFATDDGITDTRLILCNIAAPTAVYTTREIPEERLPAHFIQPMSILLAANISLSMVDPRDPSGGWDTKTRLVRLYAITLENYAAQDANQIHNKQPQDSEAIRARNGF